MRAFAHLVASVADKAERRRGVCAVQDSIHPLVPGRPQANAMQRIAKFVGLEVRDMHQSGHVLVVWRGSQ